MPPCLPGSYFPESNKCPGSYDHNNIMQKLFYWLLIAIGAGQ